MQPTATLRAVHKPLIRFLGPRANLWKDAPQHTGPHPLTPPNLVKHVPEASKPAAASKAAAPQQQGVLEFSQLAAKYKRAPISEAEMEAIESGGATFII
ncbi:hypothetical protein V8B55DRAFT_1494316 [Mucor lusitanicus]|uniref:Uncharacterized protein n=2 Tax=Mucor circinelloides f. lusitanicus TaxID=29924 RepID=A0A168MHU6_MUCCL|nr:hypothetical protein FB192DRAFT_1361202 [Mucor lusitanicus]OAD04956.1 hypothetical protein MUCCIDRAFT_108802 [Mucor lusitanicus CBS 277.49]